MADRLLLNLNTSCAIQIDVSPMKSATTVRSRNLNTSASHVYNTVQSYEFCSKDAEVVEASSSESDSTGYFYIPAENCTEDIGSVDTSLGQRGALSACEMSADVTRSEGEELWTLTLPGSTMIERIDFLDAAHLKDAVLTIEDPELPEGKQVIYTSEPLNPDGAASFSVTDEMYDASSTEYSWLVFGGVIRIHTNGAGIEGAVVKVIQGDVSQLSLNPTTAQAALVHDLTTATHNLEQAEREAYRDIRYLSKSESGRLLDRRNNGWTQWESDGDLLVATEFYDLSAKVR